MMNSVFYLDLLETNLCWKNSLTTITKIGNVDDNNELTCLEYLSLYDRDDKAKFE